MFVVMSDVSAWGSDYGFHRNLSAVFRAVSLDGWVPAIGV